MEQDGTWGDNLMLKAAADHYQTTIYVISSESRKHDRTISPEKDSNSKRLVLGHVCELHYVSLRPTPGKAFDKYYYYCQCRKNEISCQVMVLKEKSASSISCLARVA